MYHFYDGQPNLENQLIDQMQTANALIHAYEFTGEKQFLNRAIGLVSFSSERLRDSQAGGFYDTPPDMNAPGFLRQPIKALDDNSVAARALVKLYHLTLDSTYRKLAEESLRCFAETYLSFGFMSADYALAVDALLHDPTVIRIVGSRQEPRTMQLLSEAAKVYDPRKVIQILDPEADASEIQREGLSSQLTPTAYVCVGKACGAPISEPKEIPAAVKQMVAAQFRK